MQVVADFNPANVGGIWSLRCACAEATATRITATPTTRLTTAAERRRLGLDELDLLMEISSSVSLRRATRDLTRRNLAQASGATTNTTHRRARGRPTAWSAAPR